MLLRQAPCTPSWRWVGGRCQSAETPHGIDCPPDARPGRYQRRRGRAGTARPRWPRWPRSGYLLISVWR